MHEPVPELEGLAASMEEDVFSVPEAAILEDALLQIAGSDDIRSEFPSAGMLHDKYIASLESGDPEEREYGLIRLYLGLHSLGTGYTTGEAVKIANFHGISNLPGGMLPVVAASRLIGPGSASADLGAGNGLQGLLLQKIRPHRMTKLVELSSRLINAGRMFERVLGIEGGRVQWICGDILDSDLSDIDLLYIYRPAKPFGGGRRLYECIAGKLAAHGRGLTLLSVADCLGPYLADGFDLIYKDDYMSCYRGNCE